MQSEPSPEHIIHYPPYRPNIDRPSVILYGNIEKNATVDWRNELASALSDLPVAILNPYREDWDHTWVEDISFPKFKDQVEWEMDYAEVADVIAFHFASGALAPVSLLELGMHAGTGKTVVCCSPQFAKKGNVQIVCQRYGIPLVDSLDALIELVRSRLTKKLEHSGKT